MSGFDPNSASQSPHLFPQLLAARMSVRDGRQRTRAHSKSLRQGEVPKAPSASLVGDVPKPLEWMEMIEASEVACRSTPADGAFAERRQCSYP